MPLLSVVIPLFNKGFIIQKTLQSVFEQTFPDFEVILVNDGSTDDSLKVASQFTDPRIVIYSQENKGAASARNFGIKKASGDLICFLDGDDYWFPNHLEETIKLYSEFPNCGLYCSRYCIKLTQKKIIKTSYANTALTFRGILPDYFDASTKYRVGLTSALSIPKSILKGDLLFNPNVSSGQDLELYTKIAIQHPVAITDKVTVEYNYALSNQLSKTKITKKKLMDFSQFEDVEKKHPSLKAFLDMYRVEYALNFRVEGKYDTAKNYLKNVNLATVSATTQLLLKLPSFVLKKLLLAKHWLRRKGIDFSVYN